MPEYIIHTNQYDQVAATTQYYSRTGWDYYCRCYISSRVCEGTMPLFAVSDFLQSQKNEFSFVLGPPISVCYVSGSDLVSYHQCPVHHAWGEEGQQDHSLVRCLLTAVQLRTVWKQA